MLEPEISGDGGGDGSGDSNGARVSRSTREPNVQQTDRFQLALDERLLFMFVKASGVESRLLDPETTAEVRPGGIPGILSLRVLLRWLPVAVLAAALAVWVLVWHLLG